MLCPDGHEMTMVNEGYGICQENKPVVTIWWIWSFNGDDGSNLLEFSNPIENFPLPGMTSHLLWAAYSKEDAEKDIHMQMAGRNPDVSILRELPPQSFLEAMLK